MAPPSRASQVAGSIEFPPSRRGKSGRRELGPEGRNAFGFAQIQAKPFLGIEVLPAAAALQLTGMSQPPLRERVPFRGNLVEADSALHNRHCMPPGTREHRQPNDANASTTTESCTKTTAYSVRP